MTKQIINTTGINSVDYIKGRKGSFRSIVKCKAGFLMVSESLRNSTPHDVISSYRKGSLFAIEFKADGSGFWQHVFAIKGKKIVMIDEEFLRTITVGDINSNFINTELYSQRQYEAVGAETWADLAYVKN
jgi:hypothetical protein